MGDAVGAPVQFTVREALAVRHEGNSVGTRRGLLFKQLVQQYALRRFGCRVIEAMQHQFAFGLRQHGQFGDG
ncbi:hypothetical protein GCM10027277_50680 [Pseudoduganella ginsengisoli]